VRPGTYRSDSAAQCLGGVGRRGDAAIDQLQCDAIVVGRLGAPARFENWTEAATANLAVHSVARYAGLRWRFGHGIEVIVTDSQLHYHGVVRISRIVAAQTVSKLRQ
jgi:hypothetical protein